MEEDFSSVIADRRVSVGLSVIVAVRHAESVANTQGIFQGQTYDTGLSPLGTRQAQVLARRLSGRGVPKIITSPLKRTYQTAFEIARISGAPIEVDNRLMETNHGIWEGKNKDWVTENFPDVYNLWRIKPTDVQFPGGEHFSQTVERVRQFVETAQLPPGSVVVTHDNVVRIILTHAQGTPVDQMWSYELEPASLSLFEGNVVNGKNILKTMKVIAEGLRADVSHHVL